MADAAAGPATPRRSDTTDPHRSRERALKILFQADIRGVSPDVTLARLDGDPAARAMLDDHDELSKDEPILAPPGDGPTGEAPARLAPEVDGFARSLVAGVAATREEIDTLIARFARRWQISRMPVVDRTVLRLATYELLFEPTPPAVVIDEAVTLAKALSTDDSGRYVNGVLESIRKELAARGQADADPSGAAVVADEPVDADPSGI